jgi:hypothetical protein
MLSEIGATQGGMVTVASLLGSSRVPRCDYRPHAEIHQLDSGMRRGLGLPVATWTWGYLTPDERDTLRTYCTGTSAEVYIKTMVNDKIAGVSNAWKVYRAIMHWPEEERDSGYRVPFVLEFTHLVAV